MLMNKSSNLPRIYYLYRFVSTCNEGIGKNVRNVSSSYLNKQQFPIIWP